MSTNDTGDAPQFQIGDIVARMGEKQWYRIHSVSQLGDMPWCNFQPIRRDGERDRRWDVGFYGSTQGYCLIKRDTGEQLEEALDEHLQFQEYRAAANAALPKTAQPAQPAHTLTEQFEALRKEAHAAQRQGLTEVVALLKERACVLAEQYLDVGHMCDRGHYLDEYGHCPTCLEAAQQLACARAHVDQTIRRWEFEAETTGVPF